MVKDFFGDLVAAALFVIPLIILCKVILYIVVNIVAMSICLGMWVAVHAFK